MRLHKRMTLIAILVALPFVVMGSLSWGGPGEADFFSDAIYSLGLPLTQIVLGLPARLGRSLTRKDDLWALPLANLLFLVQWILWSQIVAFAVRPVKKVREKLESGPLRFEVMGGFSVVFGTYATVAACASVASGQERYLPGCIIAAICCLSVGVGLICQRKLAAVLFSLAFVIFALSLTVAGIGGIPFTSFPRLIPVVLVMLLPSWTTWRWWGELK
ncbi:MAG TPA: hypothetical protein VMP11_03980 [Verrucomicrobiae bacterium]|nr:hypothetical protein [Verrucomicrobiae bacterium]